MLPVPGGTFAMGDLDGFPDERPIRQVTVGAFCLDATEVTVAAYAACAREGLCTPAHSRPEWSTLKSLEMSSWSGFCNRDRADRSSHPANCVVWAQGDRYCSARGLRLPTEAEWEYAARGGAEARKFPWGAAPPSGELANLCGAECGPIIGAIRGSWSPLYPQDDGWAATAPVGRFPAGDARWGHHDLTGNVCEWVSGKYCPYESPDCADEGTPMCRGNHFLANNAKKARPARRNRDDRWHRSPDVGFRCAADAGITPRPITPSDRVRVYPEVPSSPRVAIAFALSLLVGVALAGFGGAAAAIVLAVLLFVAQLDPRTAISTGLLVTFVGYAAALAAPALRRRVSWRAGGPMAIAAFVGALVAGALGGFLPDRLHVAAISVATVALAVQVAWQLRRSDTGLATSLPRSRPLLIGGAGAARSAARSAS